MGLRCLAVVFPDDPSKPAGCDVPFGHHLSSPGEGVDRHARFRPPRVLRARMPDPSRFQRRVVEDRRQQRGGGDSRDQASFAFQRRARFRPGPGSPGCRLRKRRGLLPFCAHGRRFLRGFGIRSERSEGVVRSPGSTQGLHGLQQRRGRCPGDGRGRSLVDSRRPKRGRAVLVPGHRVEARGSTALWRSTTSTSSRRPWPAVPT